jgi:hypothetical protein
MTPRCSPTLRPPLLERVCGMLPLPPAEVRFARAMLFDTLPVGHCQVTREGALGKQDLDQGRFANPRFSSDENYVLVPTCCPV